MDELASFTRKFTDEVPEYTKVGMFAFAGVVKSKVDAPLLYCSTRLGEFGRGGFFPSIPLLRWVASRTDKKAVVNEKSAWLFSCKKNILKEGIISNTVKRGAVIVVNEQGEVFGWGEVTGAGITNKLDIGDYLRRER